MLLGDRTRTGLDVEPEEDLGEGLTLDLSNLELGCRGHAGSVTSLEDC